MWLLCQHLSSPGSWSLCFPFFCSSSTCALTSWRPLEISNASNLLVGIPHFNMVWIEAYVMSRPNVCSLSSHSSESSLLPPVLISSGPVDHPSISGRGEVPENLWCLSGPAFTSVVCLLLIHNKLCSVHCQERVSSSWTEAWFLFLTTSRWFALRLDGICSVFVTITTFGCLLLRNRKEDFKTFDIRIRSSRNG